MSGKNKWDLTPLFNSDNDPQIAVERKNIEKANRDFTDKWKTRTDYLKDPLILKQAIDEYEKLMRDYGTGGREEYYFWLRTMQDQTNTDLKARFAKAHDSSVKIYNELQFFEHRIAKVPIEIQKIFLQSPQLEPYKHFLEKIFRTAKYLLSEDEEKIINLKSEPAYSRWIQMTSTFISKEEEQITTENKKKEKYGFETLLSLTSNQNKKIRDNAAYAVNKILSKYTEVAESELNAILANKKIDDELRKMPRADFSRHLSDDVESEVVDALIKTVSSRYAIAQKFYSLKAKLLGVKKLAYHERNVEYGRVVKTYTFEDAVKLITRVFSNIDQEFTDIFKMFINSCQVDVYPGRGKHGGAFCAYWLITQPTYILLNYDKKLRDVTTLAHEVGHGINDELMKKKQNSLNFGTPMATAEVASTFMEDFVLQEILKASDEETKLAIMMAKLNDDISTIFRQIACYEFEFALHKAYRKKGYLAKEAIGALFQKHMVSYMGRSVEQSNGSENWWVYWSHIRSFFYVYSYASGLLISKSLQSSLKQNPEFITKIKDFLSAGLSESPKNIFKNLGIDITDSKFWEKGLMEIENLLEETTNLAKKLGKLKITRGVNL